jgi:hypothetical protein
MAKKTQIVCQHLENISRGALEQYQDIIREYIRGRHGVYALYRREKLYYVGLASNLRVRLKQHLHDKHSSKWDRFSVYLIIDGRATKELESLLLRIGKPDGNATGGRFARSENLARRLAKDVREHQRQNLRDLLGRAGRKKKKAIPAKQTDGTPPPLAKYFNRRVVLRARYKGRKYVAYVRRDGTLRYDGVIYRTPSAAGCAVRNKSTNGWQFWTYERAPGDWVRLSSLKR